MVALPVADPLVGLTVSNCSKNHGNKRTDDQDAKNIHFTNKVDFGRRRRRAVDRYVGDRRPARGRVGAFHDDGQCHLPRRSDCWTRPLGLGHVTSRHITSRHARTARVVACDRAHGALPAGSSSCEACDGATLCIFADCLRAAPPGWYRTVLLRVACTS